jgi:hypothetical protein
MFYRLIHGSFELTHEVMDRVLMRCLYLCQPLKVQAIRDTASRNMVVYAGVLTWSPFLLLFLLLKKRDQGVLD